MRVNASPEALRFVQEHGGKLYVWARRAHCCGGAFTFLECPSEPAERPFRHVLAGRRRKHVHAYDNGCAYVV